MPESPKTPLLLDGALGTELERRGYVARLPLWSAGALLDAPDLVRAIHADYVRAGAQVITAATFRTSRYTLAKAGMAERAAELTDLAVTLARDAIIEAHGDGVLIAASLAPLEDCYHPELRPDDETLQREHAHTARLLKQAGANLILVETHNSLREAQIATEAALNAALPVWISLLAKSATALFNGDSLAEAGLAAYALGVDAVLVNCCPVAVAAAALQTLQAALPPGDVLVGVYPNFSSGQGDPWEFDAPLSAAAFAAWAQSLTPAPDILGGCCGTTPAHIAALKRGTMNDER